MSEVFNPMKGVVIERESKPKVPAGQYEAEFVKGEYLPSQEPDPMTGAKGRQWASVRFTWRVAKGEHAGQFVARETSVPTNGASTKTAFVAWCGYLLGRTLGPEGYDLSSCVGKRYLITVGEKRNKAGQPTGWHHVEQCLRLPD
jgi:hypothetical protein